MKKLLVITATAILASGCTTIYSGAATTADGGMYLSGQVDGKKTMFYCPSSTAKADCSKVKVINK